MNRLSPHINTRATVSDAILIHCLFHSVSTWPLTLGKAQIVVRAEVEHGGGFTSQLEGAVVILGFSVEQSDFAARYSSYGTIPAISDSYIQTTGVETFKVRVQGGITPFFPQMSVSLLTESFPEKVADMSCKYQNHIAKVGGEQHPHRGLFFLGHFNSDLRETNQIAINKVCKASPLTP
eukprot:Lithocolla_globosa_v1_NODE_3416_length_1677_cov_44.881628.p2 type:complete len:179 gc:universal NODE_3416_length_1677_cov_44.881628:1132-1668(+)